MLQRLGIERRLSFQSSPRRSSACVLENVKLREDHRVLKAENTELLENHSILNEDYKLLEEKHSNILEQLAESQASVE
jgi:hypothetical protein